MTPEIGDRDKLFAKLRDVLGIEEAATLMGLIPDQVQFATKADFLVLKSDIAHLDDRMDRLEKLMEGFGERLWDFHSALRSQTRVNITAMVSSMIGVGGLAFAAALLA